MVKTNLTDEEKKLIIEALNNNIELPPELMIKLFPGLAEKFDVAKLDRAKIVTLEYAGKRSEAAILNQASPTDAGSPLQVERCFRGGSLTGETQLDLFEKAKHETDDNWHNLIVQGDNLQFLKTCYLNADPLIKGRVKGKVKLIYIDPPFATKSDFQSKTGQTSYTDRIASAEFIENLRERLFYFWELLSEDGSIFVHLDWKKSHYIKIVLDEIFGVHNFINEVVWHYRKWSTNIKAFQKNHDTILWYAKRASDKNRKFEVVAYEKPSEGTLKRWKGKKQLAKFDDSGKRLAADTEEDSTGAPISDVWTDIEIIEDMQLLKVSIINPAAVERTEYPTQKPEALLYRIIRAVTKNDDLVMDVFAGSGTTSAVAEKLGRRWIVCDFGKHAIYTMQKRMLKIGESKALCHAKGGIKKNQKYNKPPKPFCVVSTGAYDFSRIMKLRENKDAYIDFVLGLFQSSRDEKDLSGKYRLANIFGEKDGDPVEVYPVWNDEYLKNIRIDEKYLKGIILQSRGKLKGNYYIITPETCTLVGDTTMKNSAGNDVHFKMLKFPYKILEDVSRNFQIQQQPSSQENVNNLINSTGFYFNDDIEIAVERIKQGLKITRFETKILDKQEKRLKGLDGLAMLLVDVDYDGKIFDMDRTVFAKDIGDDGMIKMTGLTESIAVIAIDKHGNESKPFIV